MVWVCTVGVGDGGVPLSSQLCSSFVDSTVVLATAVAACRGVATRVMRGVGG
jgi:hypothetical protein